MRWPVSVKGVVIDSHGHVLLGKNDRDEWELLGGRLEAGEDPEETVVRELAEESGLIVAPQRLLRAWVLEPFPGSAVLIVTYGCTMRGGELRGSAEHSAVRFHESGGLAKLALPEGYLNDIALWQSHQAQSAPHS